MKHGTALHLVFCFHLAGLVCAAPPRKDAKDANGRQLATEVSLEASDDRPVSLLAIMQGLQVKRLRHSDLSSEVQRQGRIGQSEHERQLLTDMGHLESELESWRQAEKNLEHQVSQQSATVSSLRNAEAQAIHDEMVAATVWWDCKMMLCLLTVAGMAFCIYASNSHGSKPVFNVKANAAEQVPQQQVVLTVPVPAPRRVVPAQPQFVEKDAGHDVEDNFPVMLAVPQPTESAVAEQSALEAAAEVKDDVKHIDTSTALVDIESPPAETLAEPMEHKDSLTSSGARRESVCQYFNMDEPEPPVQAGAEEDWFNDSGY